MAVQWRGGRPSPAVAVEGPGSRRACDGRSGEGCTPGCRISDRQGLDRQWEGVRTRVTASGRPPVISGSPSDPAFDGAEGGEGGGVLDGAVDAGEAGELRDSPG